MTVIKRSWRDFLAGVAAVATVELPARSADLRMPMTIKGAFNGVGLPTTWGIPAFAKWRAREGADAVTRLKDAGVVILGEAVAFGLADWQS